MNWELVVRVELSWRVFLEARKDIILKFFAGALLLFFLYTAKPELFNPLLVGGSGSMNLSLPLAPAPLTARPEFYAASVCSFLTRFILTVTPPLFWEGLTFLFLEGAVGGGG